MDFWTGFYWVDVILTTVPALLFFAWVIRTDRKIVKKAAAARRKFAGQLAD